jgi:hypothetical protein
MQSTFARLLALAIALSAGIGIAIHVQAEWSQSGSLLDATWILARYFTILTNLIVAVVFSIIALRGPGAVGPRLLGGATICIALVGVIYALLLHGLVEPAERAALSNVLLHMVTPALGPIYWLFFVRRRALRWSDPLFWAIYPATYLGYALVRGAADGRFAYPFINYVDNGVPQVAVTVVIITLAFLAAGWLMVLLDKRLAS